MNALLIRLSIQPSKLSRNIILTFFFPSLFTIHCTFYNVYGLRLSGGGDWDLETEK